MQEEPAGELDVEDQLQAQGLGGTVAGELIREGLQGGCRGSEDLRPELPQGGGLQEVPASALDLLARREQEREHARGRRRRQGELQPPPALTVCQPPPGAEAFWASLSATSSADRRCPAFQATQTR